MADLTIVATEVLQAEDGAIRRGAAGEAVTAGQCVYFDDRLERWFLSRTLSTIDAATVEGIALNTAGARQALRVQTEGTPCLGASAGVVVGMAYGLSRNPGNIAPLTDVQAAQYRTFLGIGNVGHTIALGIFNSGVEPGSLLNTTLTKFVLAGRVSDNTAQVSAIIDRLGYEEVTFHFNIGTIADADATFTTLLEGGNVANLSDAAPVADADMISQTLAVAPELAASWTFAHDNQVRKLGYRDDTTPYRYLRLTVTPTLNTGAADFCVYCILGAGLVTPVTQVAA